MAIEDILYLMNRDVEKINTNNELEMALSAFEKLSAGDITKYNLGKKARHVYEGAISRDLGREPIPSSYNGYDTDITRAEASRKWLILSREANKYHDALALSKMAKERGISLDSGMSVEALSDKYEHLKKQSEDASKGFNKTDLELCIRDYLSWRIANK